MLGLLGVGGALVAWDGEGKGWFFIPLGSHLVTRFCEPQVIALGTYELLCNCDASSPWLRIVGLWSEDTGQRNTVGSGN